MTQNQIAYQRLKEDTRHNQATELETNRANVANLAETNRHNIAYEQEVYRHNLQDEDLRRQANIINSQHLQAMDAETKRNNIAIATETNRHNVAMEQFNLGQLEVQRKQAAAAQQQADAASRNASSNAQNAATNAANLRYVAINSNANQQQAQASLMNAASTKSRVSHQNALDDARARAAEAEAAYSSTRGTTSWIDSISNAASKGFGVLAGTKSTKRLAW